MITLILITLLLIIILTFNSVLVEKMTLMGLGQKKELQYVRLAQGHLESPEARARLPNF
jgi:hypothetical protein